MDKFTALVSLTFGGFGLVVALRDLGFSWVATIGLALAFMSLLYVLLVILSFLEQKL